MNIIRSTARVGIFVGLLLSMTNLGGGLQAASARIALSPQDLLAGDHFGISVSASGNLMAVGAPGDSFSTHAGAVYIFQKNESSWTQQAKLIAPGAFAGDTFGASVALEGNTLVVGSPADGTAGLAFVFVFNNGFWQYQQLIRPSDSALFGNFGAALSLSRSTIAVGAPFLRAGAVYVYVFDSVSGFWNQQAKLIPNDPSNFVLSFGGAVAVQGDSMIVGAPRSLSGTSFSSTGSAYAFNRRNGVWTQDAILAPSDHPANAMFGFSVSMSGSGAAIGAPIGGNSGAAYVYSQNNGLWIEMARVSSTVASSNTFFGYSAAIAGNTLAVGAPGDANVFGGSAFTFGGNTWQQTGQLIFDTGVMQGFGKAVAAPDGNTTIVGAPDWGTTAQPALGAVYIFQR